MKCISCGSEELWVRFPVMVSAPLAKKGGSIKVGGVKVTQVDVKHAWDHIDGDPSKDVKQVRGPIICLSCGQEMAYVKDHASNPVDYAAALEAHGVEE